MALFNVEGGDEKYSGISLPIWGGVISTMALTLWLGFFRTASGKSLFVVQRLGVLYWASVVVVATAFLLAMVCSAIYLILHQRRWDRVAYAAAEIGTLFCTIVIAIGPFWVRSGWKFWWIWDDRFTTTCVLWVLAGIYLLVRKYVSGETGRLLSAVWGMLLFWVDLVIYLGMRWWQALHPTALRLEGWGASSVAFGPSLGISIFSFLLVFAYLLQHRVATEVMQDDLEEVRQAFLSQEQQIRDFRIENQDFVVEGYTFKEYKKYE